MKYQIIKCHVDNAIYTEEQVISYIGQRAYDSCSSTEEVLRCLNNVMYSKNLCETDYEHLQTGDDMEGFVLNNDLSPYITLLENDL